MHKNLLAAGALLLISSASHAQNLTQVLGGDLYEIQDAVNTLNAKAFPVVGLSNGVNELKIIPSYVGLTNEFDNADVKMRGGGIGASYFKGLSDHWGYAVMGSFMALDGDSIGIRELTGANFAGFVQGNMGGFGATQVNSVRMQKMGLGWQVSSSVVFDPTRPGRRVRFPMMLGLGLMYLSHDVKGTYTAVNNANTVQNVLMERRDFIPGVFAAVSAQIDAGGFQFSPFFGTQINLKDASQTKTVTNAATGAELYRQEYSTKELLSPSLGLGIAYKPWGLEMSITPSFYYLLSIISDNEDDAKITLLTLSKTFQWGS